MSIETFKTVCLWLIMVLYAAQAVVLFLTHDRPGALIFACYAASCVGFIWSLS